MFGLNPFSSAAFASRAGIVYPVAVTETQTLTNTQASNADFTGLQIETQTLTTTQPILASLVGAQIEIQTLTTTQTYSKWDVVSNSQTITWTAVNNAQ